MSGHYEQNFYTSKFGGIFWTKYLSEVYLEQKLRQENKENVIQFCHL